MDKPTYTRDDLRRYWSQHFEMPRNADDSLAKKFMHFPEGTPVEEVWEWFEAEHARLDATVEAIVEIKTPGIFSARRHRYPAKVVTFKDGQVFTDGVEREELFGESIVGVEWLSNRGVVKNLGGSRICGYINGVMMDVHPSRSESRTEHVGDQSPENDAEEPSITFGPR